MTEPSADERLRDALDAFAGGVRADATTYNRVSAGWRRRYRHRRLVQAILAAVVFLAADAAGLWALSQADPHTHVIFSDPRRPAQPVAPVAPVAPVDRIGQP